MTSNRIRYLDGLRGLLAVVVFIHHFFYIYYPDIIFGGQSTEYLSPSFTFNKFMAFTPFNILFNPGMAIHFFFLLSGYVQSFRYLRDPDLMLLQKSFFKRYFRLAIPTAAVLLLVFLCHKMHLVRKDLVPADPITGGWSQSMMPDSLSFVKLVKQAFADVFIKDHHYYQVLWTMPIELINSWMTLVLLFISHGLPYKNRIFISWLIIQLFLLQSYYSAAFTLGILLCNGEINHQKFRRIVTMPLLRFFFLVAGLYFASYPFIGYEKSTVHSLYAPISFFEKYPHIISYLFGDLLLFLFLLGSERLKSFLSGRIMLFFGDISFMLYLVHLLILFTFSAWLYHALSQSVSKNQNLFITGIASMMVITGVSYVLYTFVDKPALRWCSSVTRKFFGI